VYYEIGETMLLSILKTEIRLRKKGQGASFSWGQLAGLILLVIFLLAIIIYIRSQSQTGQGIVSKIFG
jgi:hypothetical protein